MRIAIQMIETPMASAGRERNGRFVGAIMPGGTRGWGGGFRNFLRGWRFLPALIAGRASRWGSPSDLEEEAFAPEEPVGEEAEQDEDDGEGERGVVGGVAVREEVVVGPEPGGDGARSRWGSGA